MKGYDMSEFTFENLKVVHLYIEGGGDENFVRAAMDELHPGFLKFYKGEIITHAVSPWPDKPFSHAYVDLRMNYEIELKQTNCKIGEREALGKKVFVVFYMGE
jgi:hypothetical protein